MRLHLLALPNVQTTKAYSLDGFCVATIRFAKMMKDIGHTVILYASEENEAPCDELVTVITKAEQKALSRGEYQYEAMNENYPLWSVANPRIIEAIRERKQPRDLLLTIGGASQKVIADAHPDLPCVEYSIGYIASFAPYRIYESCAWQHWSHGQQQNQFGRFFDEVIPYFFDEQEFIPRVNKENFTLYVGRLTQNKGLTIACRAAKLAGVPLKVIGHGDPALVTDGAEYLGVLPDAERNDWMSRASSVLCPTLYLEPFGAVAVEAQLSGTPVISTNFGGFTETVEHGKTGFRCAYLGQFAQALKEVYSLDPNYIRQRAVEKYSMHRLKYSYERYFDKLSMLWDKGWDTTSVNVSDFAPSPIGSAQP
jgi:glycosyltransferase involved in cell wall biosynthesis